MLFSRALLGLAAATLTLAQQQITFVNIDDQDRTIVWGIDHNTTTHAPDPIYLSGAGASGTVFMAPFVTENNGFWSGRARAINGTATTYYKDDGSTQDNGALAEFTWTTGPIRAAWFDVSWNELIPKDGPVLPTTWWDPTGIKMMIATNDPSTASGCVQWNLTAGCGNSYYFNRDGGGYTRTADYEANFVIIVGGPFGIISGPEVTDWTPYKSMIEHLPKPVPSGSPATPAAGGLPAASPPAGAVTAPPAAPPAGAVTAPPATPPAGALPTPPAAPPAGALPVAKRRRRRAHHA